MCSHGTRGTRRITETHARGATVDPDVASEHKGWPGPGCTHPRRHHRQDLPRGPERVFWDVQDARKTFVVELEDDTYRRLVIQVSDPRATSSDRARSAATLTGAGPTLTSRVHRFGWGRVQGALSRRAHMACRPAPRQVGARRRAPRPTAGPLADTLHPARTLGEP